MDSIIDRLNEIWVKKQNDMVWEILLYGEAGFILSDRLEWAKYQFVCGL